MVRSYAGSLGMLRGLWIALACFVLPLYLPAVICLFPYPKISEEGISCIKLEDPSPAGIRSLVVKAFVPQNNNSVLNCVRFLLLRVIFVPCMAFVPIILGSVILKTYEMTSFISSPLYIFSYCAYILESLMATFWPQPQKPCKYCRILFPDPVLHSTLAERLKAHLSLQICFCVTRCRLFSCYYLNLCEKHLGLRLDLSKGRTMCLCKALYFTVVLLPALLGLIVGSGSVLLVAFLATCPIFNLNYYDRLPNYFRRILQYRCRHVKQDAVYCFSRSAERIVLSFSTVAVGVLVYTSAVVSGEMLLYSILLIVNDAEVLFPYIAMAFLILYYLRGCFSVFTEKYQLVKIKLYQSCKRYQQLEESNGGLSPHETKLILYTKDKDVAIPEELYEAAIQELRIPIMRNLWIALLKMLGVLVAAICIFISIMVFSTHSGIAPFTQTVFVFLAGSLPKLFSVFSSGGSAQKLEEFNMEEQLDSVIAEYAHNQSRNFLKEESIIERIGIDVTDIEMEEFPEHTSETEFLEGVEENNARVEE